VKMTASSSNTDSTDWPSHDGKEWTIWMLQSFGKVHQLFLQQKAWRSLRKLASNHRTATFN